MRKQSNVVTLPSLDLVVLLRILACRINPAHPSAVHFQLSSAIIFSSLLPCDISVVPLSGLPLSGILGAWMCDALHRRCLFWTFKNVPNVCGHQTWTTLENMCFYCFHHSQRMNIGWSTIKKTRYLRRAPGWLHIKPNMQKISGTPSAANQMHVNQECLTQKYNFPMQVLDWKSMKVMDANTLVMYNLVLNDLEMLFTCY